MKTAEAISNIKYLEALHLPKFKASLDRLLNKRQFDEVLDCQHITRGELPAFVEKAVDEGNAVLIEPEHNGYCVILWKG